MSIMKLLAYVPQLTPRIKYIFNFIFHDVLKTEIGFCTNIQEFKDSNLPKISYCNQAITDEIHFKNADLLLGHNIIRTAFKTTAFGDTIVPFAVNGGTLPFDPFAASFYFISRYEEYIHFNPDDEGHYPAEISLQSRLKLLQIPVIDGWAMILKNILLKKHPSLYFGKKSFNFVPITCMFPGSKYSSSFLKSARQLIRKVQAVLKRNVAEANQSAEIYEFLKTEQDKYHLKGLFFYQSPDNENGEADGQADLPNSYLQLLKTGTRNDYRMGYQNTPGFRAGTCTPFLWYDLQLEKTTHLMVHPIAINDLCLTADKMMRTDSVLNKWKNMVDMVKLMNGQFYVVWHQDTLTQPRKGKYAQKLYREMLSNFLSLPNDLRPE
ncbi:DUF7033 domain-containing protein [Pedobacter sp.]|uniref:DUF7033 domain-containing protein n=1 Tax=Pedobacter sp. TaxID=1411316 RepID=UPI003D7FE852